MIALRAFPDMLPTTGRINRKRLFKQHNHREKRFDNRRQTKLPSSIRANKHLELRIVDQLSRLIPLFHIYEVHIYEEKMSRPDQLSLISYLAPNMFGFYEAVGAYVSRVMGRETQLVQSQYDPLEDPMMLQEQLDIAFICGLPFARRHREVSTQLKALVAPVMQANRYQDRPVYFSDIIVNAQSNLLTFDDLEGKTFSYNDPGSNSGYNLVRHRLFQGGYPKRFFGKVIQSGSHQRSIRLVVDGLADCAAIDSTVMEQELRDWPELSNHLRVIDSIGPCPMPPVVAAQHLGAPFLHSLQSALCQPDTELISAMQRSHIRHYVAVHSEDYEVLATMYDTALQAGYEAIG